VTPPTWDNLTSAARKWVYANVRKGRQTGAVLESFLHFALDTNCDEVYAFLKPITRDLGKWEVIIGWRGRFQDGVVQDARDMLHSADIG